MAACLRPSILGYTTRIKVGDVDKVLVIPSRAIWKKPLREKLIKESFAAVTDVVTTSDELLSDDERTLAPKPEWKSSKRSTRGRRKKLDNQSEEGKTQASKKLEWLNKDKVDFNDERTILRVNRTIAQASSVKEALLIVEEMKAAGLNAANEGTFVALITVCRRQRQGERGLIVYEAMKQSNIKPGIWTYNALISCCQQAQKVETAFKLKEEMEAAGVEPNVVTYTALMALVIKSSPYRGRSPQAQRFQKACALLEEMLAKGIQPDVVTLNTLLYGGAKGKLPDKVMEVYGKMSSMNVAPDTQTFRILLEAVSKSGRLQSSLEVFNEMKALGVQPSTATFNMLLEACGMAAQPDSAKAWELFEELQRSPPASPNAETLQLLLTASFKAKDHKGALKAYQLTKDLGFEIQLSVSTYNKLIVSAEAEGGLQDAFQIFAAMKEQGFSPDVVTLGTLVTLCGQTGQVEKALGVLEEFGSLGIKPDSAVYRAIIGLYGNTNQWEKALSTFQELQATFPEESSDLASFSSIFDACFGEGGLEKHISNKDEIVTLTLNEALLSSVDLYQEASRRGLFDNFSQQDLIRCNVRELSKPALAVCIVAWLESLRQKPVDGDVVLVTGSDRGRAVLGKGRGRYPKLHITSQRVLQALGLNPKNLQALTMQALTVEKEDLDAWFEKTSRQ